MNYSESRSVLHVNLPGASAQARDERLRELAVAVDRALEDFADDAVRPPLEMFPFRPFERFPNVVGYRTQMERPGRIHYEVAVRPRPANHDQAEVVVSWINKPKEGMEGGLVAAYTFLFFGFTALAALLFLVFWNQPFEPRHILLAALVAVVPSIAATAVVAVLFVVPYRKRMTARERIDELCAAIRAECETD